MTTHARPSRAAIAVPALALALVAALLVGCDPVAPSSPDHAQGGSSPSISVRTPAPPAPADASLVTTVKRVVDGDTITVAADERFGANDPYGVEHSIRLLGIDAPERDWDDPSRSECGAEEAYQRLAELLVHGGQGVEIAVVYDPDADRTDRYMRSLAYVEVVLPDGSRSDVAETLAAEGLARAWFPRSAPAPARYAGYAELAAMSSSLGEGSHGACESIGR